MSAILGTKRPSNDSVLKTTTWGTRLALLALITLLAAGLSLADSKKSKLSKDADALKGGHKGATVDVIIQFNQTPTEAHHQKVRNKGGALKTKLDFIKSGHYSVPTEALDALAGDPDVAYITPNRPVKGSLDHVVSAVNADLAYASGWDGTGVGIAVIDSGVSSVYDLNTDDNNSSRLVYSQSFVAGDSSTGDAFGHGTHIAGIVAGNGYLSSTSNYPGVYRGIASEAKIVNLRVLDSTGAGTDSSVIAAIQQAISLKNTYNIRVINLSLARGVYESYKLDPLCQAVESAWRAGIVVVVAAGNMGQYDGANTNGYATIGAPGNDPYVITVGATNTHGTGAQTAQVMTSYSSKGPTAFDHVVKPDLVAPGNGVVSRMAQGGNVLVSSHPALAVYPCNSSRLSCGPQFGSARYMRLSGTSMATPVVSGVVALLLEKTPSLTPDQVKARLMKSAWKGFASYITATDKATGVVYQIEQDLFAVGAGAVDASAALANTDSAPPSFGAAKSPTAVYNSLTNTISIVGEPSTIWNNSVVWGDSLVWGNSVVWGDSLVWGNSVVWGDSLVWGNSDGTLGDQ